jgi:hypothetical protein
LAWRGRRADEWFHPEPILELHNGLGECGLPDVETTRGGGKGAGIDHLHEILHGFLPIDAHASKEWVLSPKPYCHLANGIAILPEPPTRIHYSNQE